LLFSGGSTFSQPNKNQILSALVSDLTKDTKTEVEKARAIYEWVQSNIRYDWKKFERWKVDSRSITLKPISELLSSKTGICMDFADLGSKMFTMAGIENVTIYGLARYEVDDIFGQPAQMRHAWNAIRVNQKWELVDLTWASALYQYGDSSQYFFMPPPDKFIFTHFPDSSKLAFLDKDVSQREFLNFPIVRWNNLKADVASINKVGHLVPTKENIIELILPQIENIDFELMDDNRNVFVADFKIKEKQGNNVTYEVKLPHRARFTLIINQLVEKDESSEQIVPLMYFGITE